MNQDHYFYLSCLLNYGVVTYPFLRFLLFSIHVVNLNTQNNFIHEGTNLRFHSFTKIWFDYENKKETNVNKAIRNENATTTTHLQDLQAPRDIVKRN